MTQTRKLKISLEEAYSQVIEEFVPLEDVFAYISTLCKLCFEVLMFFDGDLYMM